MNLPFILDLSLGLIFIYLILSLLASEIQELIATIFQWRAVHLKKSIENLIAGNVSNGEEEKVVQLANHIYSSPLIRNINQEAKGFLVNLPRKLTWTVASASRSLLPKSQSGVSSDESVFGNQRRSGPSYIPSDIFATTLIETLQLPTLVQKLTENRLDKFKTARLNELQEIIFQLEQQAKTDEQLAPFFSQIYQEFSELQAEFEQVTWNFQQQKANLLTSLDRMAEGLDRYIESFQMNMPQQESVGKALRRIKFLRQDIFNDTERAISLGGLRPNLQEIAQSVNTSSAVYQEIAAALEEKDSKAYQQIQQALDILPDSVAENLLVLAQRAQVKINSTEDGINLLRREIENTFDSSMERASGVYRRNAKGVAILIGFALAVTANADAFHMISRLSKDSALRDTITKNAGEILLRNYSNSTLDLEALRVQTDEVLTQISLPIGWTDTNLEQQIGWTQKQERNFPVWRIIPMIPGWILSGIAISMGAPFWFDLLSKIVNVRNAGNKPPTAR
ncbi:hypothetical protein [Calothrix sp. 336/3]|uniref:hypothetical protein n=1 Tax=Calothrix sp. 336/3 TaxID=1337936 RepID=UPI0004E32F50|nr:hypothetical protein [Calothrix sp. 336/3]AKG20612.1 hypothetical protein IJ00_04115 [Calothrix sp. 336/3]